MKITFSRGITFLVCAEMTALLVVSCFVMKWPPTAFCVCWLCFWSLVEVGNITLKERKHKRDNSESFTNAMVELIKTKNISNQDIIDFATEIKEVIK